MTTISKQRRFLAEADRRRDEFWRDYVVNGLAQGWLNEPEIVRVSGAIQAAVKKAIYDERR